MKFEIENGRLLKCLPEVPDKLIKSTRPRIRVCTQELDMEIPQGVTTINRQTFDEVCSYVETVKLPDGLNTLLAGLFRRFVNLEELVIGEGPEIIPPGFLKNSIKLKKITIPASVKTISNNAFYGCSKLEVVEICGDGLENIGKEAFWGCNNISSINFPKSLKKIEDRAFERMKMKKLVLNSNIEIKYGWDGPFFFSGVEEIEMPDANGEIIHMRYERNPN